MFPLPRGDTPRESFAKRSGRTADSAQQRSHEMGGPHNQQLHGFMVERRRAPQQRASDRSTLAQLARQTVAIVLAGGRGSRLGPLTEWRAKPAVPFGGKFKII